ncbi:ParB N-terminal domain-containing protein [Aeromonas veronii]|uniref:hypothetical protein n=1 Tax=Aeromonas veronii TaxID=654 RepID=UPI002B46E082|nr:hypothetical protein [Aeromonas veronii]
MTTDKIEILSPALVPTDTTEKSTAHPDSAINEIRSQKTINASTIIISPEYQYRVGPLDNNNVAYLATLIQDGVPFATPIRLQCLWGSQLYLVDGFHRMEAFKRLGITEIPIHHFSIEEADSSVDVQLHAMGANTKHGKRNSAADYRNIIAKIVEKGYPRELMKNAFEPDIPAIAKAIGTSKTVLEVAYNKFTGFKDNPHPTLSVECKTRRNEAIIEAYCDGLTANAIAEMYRIKSPKTVAQVITDAEAKWAENERMREEQAAAEKAALIARAAEHGYSEDKVWLFQQMAHFYEDDDTDGSASQGNTENVESSVIPMADASDRSTTRVDANTHIPRVISSLDDTSAPTEKADEPFDVYKATGYKPDQTRHAKPVKPEDMTTEQLQEAWKAHQKAKAKIERQEEKLRKAAAQMGVILAE